jgi:hypothetical protein
MLPDLLRDTARAMSEESIIPAGLALYWERERALADLGLKE